MDVREYREFRIGEMFDIATGRDIIIGKTVPGKTPLISHQSENNGIAKYIDRIPERRLFNFKNTIALADRGLFHATAQSENFQIGTRVKALTFKDGEKSVEIRMFVVAAINKHSKRFEQYLENATDKLPNLKISLPVTSSGDPDWQYMEEHIKELEKERIKELEAYLQEAGLSDCTLTDKDLEVLAIKPKMREFRIGELFDVSSSRKIIHANTVNISEEPFAGSHPYVVRSSQNNGIRGYIEYGELALNPGNTFSFSQDTADVFFQTEKYFTGNNVKIFHPMFDMSENVAMYILPAVKRSFSGFGWGQNLNEGGIKNKRIWLPIKETPTISSKLSTINCIDIIDLEYMDSYIQAIKKRSVAGVVAYKDSVIAETRKIVAA